MEGHHSDLFVCCFGEGLGSRVSGRKPTGGRSLRTHFQEHISRKFATQPWTLDPANPQRPSLRFVSVSKRGGWRCGHLCALAGPAGCGDLALGAASDARSERNVTWGARVVLPRKRMAVGQTHGPKWHLGRWNPSSLILSHTHMGVLGFEVGTHFGGAV